MEEKIFLEATPKQLKTLAWAFAWRYVLSGLFLTIALTLFEKFAHPKFSIPSGFFYAYFFPLIIANSLKNRKRISDFRMMLATSDGQEIILNKESTKGLGHAEKKAITRQNNRLLHRMVFRFLRNYIISILLFAVTFAAIVFAISPSQEAFVLWLEKYIDLINLGGTPFLNLVAGYFCSYFTFRHVLRKDYEVGKVRLVAADAA